MNVEREIAVNQPVFEESLVSIVRSDGVSIAYPARMSRFELASALHGLAGALFRDATASAHDSSGEAQAPPLETSSDRRGMPRQKVVRRTRIKGGTREKLACGHTIDLRSNQKRHERRSCPACAQEQAVASQA